MFTTTLNVACARHRALLDDLDSLEKEAGHLDAAALRTRMIKAREDLMEHFHFEEHGGYMLAVLGRDPNLSHPIDRLKAEHRELRMALDGLLWRFENPDALTPALRADIKAWVACVRSHETRENELIQDAFGRDTGAGD
jgi:hypothetical protein